MALRNVRHGKLSLSEIAFLVGFSDHVESTGLGLSSSRVLATLMHGDLRYRRVDGVTEFTLTLPAAHPSTAITTSEPSTEKPSA